MQHYSVGNAGKVYGANVTGTVKKGILSYKVPKMKFICILHHRVDTFHYLLDAHYLLDDPRKYVQWNLLLKTCRDTLVSCV